MLRRVGCSEGAAIVGRNGSGDFAGIVFPYIWPGEDHVREFRLRRDHPDLEHDAAGKLKERGKYLSPPGRGNMLYFVPGTDPNWLQDTSLLAVVTEGEKKCLGLWALGWHGLGETAMIPRFLPIGLGGVWNWRGTVGKASGPGGDRRDVKGPIADLARLVWKNRDVLIVFDANVTTNDSVRVARSQLARELSRRGARVSFVDVPDVEGVNGVDDLIGLWGPERVLKLFERPARKPNTIHVGPRFATSELAQAITADSHFAVDQGGKLYVYHTGTYKPCGESYVKRRVKTILGALDISRQWSSRKAEEIIKYIAVDAPELLERPDTDVVNVENGLLNVRTRQLRAHSPEFLSPVQIPLKFDPTARCPAWDKFIGEVFPGDAEAIAWEIPAWLMTPDTSIQKAVLLIGDGANGKSTYLRAVMAFLGKHNASAVSLHKLENDRFSAARLVGRLANICPDLPTTDLVTTSVFKAITGGDPLMAEYKFKDSFEFVPYSRLIFSANHPPKSQDASPAFFRRWVVVPFERTFTEGAPGTIPSDRLDAMLSDPVELSGVLNKALEATAVLRNRGLSESDSTRQALDEFRQVTDPLAVWLDRHTILHSDAVIPQDRLYREYRHNCDDTGRPTITKTAFGRAMKKLRPKVEGHQRTVDGALVWCYVGIGFIAKEGE
jgi:putative DNA primase/helicase